MLKRTRFIFGLLAVIMTLSMLGGFVLPTSAGDVEEATLVSVQNATAADTADDAPQNYRIDTIEELIYASQNPSFYGAGDTIFLMADLDLNQYNGEFITDFYNFGKNTGGSTHFKANFDGMGHTIYNYTETLPFFSGTLDSTVRNLIFENATITAGATPAAVVARTTEYGATLDNVHVRNSTVTTENQLYAGILVALVNSTNNTSSKPLTLLNCSVANSHIICNYNGAASYMGLFVGIFQTSACLKIKNCMAVNSSISGLTPISYTNGILIGEVGHKNLVIQIGNFEKTLCGTTAQLDNIGSYNCSFINYGTETTSYAAISGMKRGGTITADHIYAFDTKRSSAAESQVADTAMENLFYAFSTACKLNLNDCLTNASTTYKLAYDNTNASDATDIALPEEFIAQDTSLPALITQMNQTKGKNHLKWKLDETGLPVTTYFDNALFTPGDVNNDGTVDVLDALVVLRLLSGETYTGELNERAMFVNDDKIVDTSDATLILQKAAGKEVTLLAASADETIVINEEGNYCFESSLAFDTATIKVLSQNILHSGSFTHPNGLNGSTYRRARIKTLIETYKADLIGLQEYRHDGWFTFFEDELLPADSYGNYIVSRADPNRDTAEEAKELFTQYAGNEAAQRANALTPDERLAIFWKKDAFELVDDTKGIFWFSDTPDVHSPSFGTVSNEELELHSSGNYYVDNRARITIWVKLRVIGTNLEFYYFNFHFPNASGTAARTTQVKSVQLLTSQVEKICAEYGNAPVILGGDMNTDYFYEADWPALYEMEKNFSDVALQYMEEQGETDQPDGTFPSFGSNVSEDGSVDSRIDYFFVRNNDGTGIQHFEVLNKTFKADGTMQDTYGTYNADWENTDYGASEIVDPETEGENEGNNEDNKDTTKAYYLKFNDTYYVSDHFGLYGEFVISNKLSAVSDLTLNTPSTATVETENDLPITLALTGLDDDNTCSPGDELTATIALKEGANLSSLPLTLTYDPMVLELITNAETALMTCEQKETSGETVTAAFYSKDNITAGGTLLTAKFKVINTTTVTNSSVTASIAPIFDSAYYAARYDSNGIPYAVDYSSESISSTFNSYAAIAQNTTTGANYFDLTTALNEAAENETVVLLQDTEVSEIVVNTGSTFDLNGHVLKTDTVLSYGDIVDGAENGVGGVQIPANTEDNENMILQPTNAQLPLYDQANGCYRFFACSVESAGYKNGTNTSVKFGYYLKFEKKEAYTLLKNGADTTGMTFSVDLTWDNLGKIIPYNFSSNTVATMANYWLNGSTGVALTLTVTGLENITDQTLVTTPVAHSIDVSITAETANSYKVPFFEIGGTADSDWG